MAFARTCSFRFHKNSFTIYCRTLSLEPEATNLFDQDVMTWRIMKDLPRLATRPEFPAISNYSVVNAPNCAPMSWPEESLTLSSQYLVFRPKMILDWDAGEGNDWQPILWRQLQQAAPGQHQAALGLRLIDALKRDRAPVPERVSIFGISTLPPFYISLIGEISARLSGPSFCNGTDSRFGGAISVRNAKKHERSNQNCSGLTRKTQATTSC
jgi:exodeoxyribonuclease V gamma subunit